jgi:integrase
MRLTIRTVETLRPASVRREIPDSLMVGLYLVIHSTGRKVWAVRYRFRGLNRKFTLGPFPAIGLKDARELAGKALRAVAEGRDPGREKLEARSARVDSIDSIVDQFIERHCKRANRPRTAAETERLLRRHVLPRWHGRMIHDITRRDVLDVLDRIMDGGTPIEANRTLAAVRKLFNWALSRDIIAVSPCAGVKPPSAETARDRVLTDDELRLVWQAAEQMGYPFGPVVQMLVLTGQRRDEVRKMTWDEVDLERRLWKLAAGRTKNNKPHDIPLSAPVVAVLESLPRIVGSRVVFTLDGVKPAGSLSYHKSRLDALSGVASWTLHDLRRTCASGLARLGVNLPAIEKILNHTSGSFRGVVGIYQRHDFGAEKAKALELWGQHIDGLVKPNILRLRGGG